MSRSDLKRWIERIFKRPRKDALYQAPTSGEWLPCVVCSNLRGAKLDGSIKQPKLKFTDISLAADSGCCTCQLLAIGILHIIPEVRQASEIRVAACWEPYRPASLRIAVTGRLPGYVQLNKKIEFYTLRSKYIHSLCNLGSGWWAPSCGAPFMPIY